MKQQTSGIIIFLTYFFSFLITQTIVDKLGLIYTVASNGVSSQTVINFIIKVMIFILVSSAVKFLLIKTKEMIDTYRK